MAQNIAVKLLLVERLKLLHEKAAMKVVKAEVIWGNDIHGWAIKSEQLEIGSCPMAHMDSFEIIGNIYETPELITQK